MQRITVARSGEPSAGRRRPRRSAGHSGKLMPIVEAMGPPVSTVAWSPRFVAQTLEILPVGVRDGKIFWLKPVHADSLHVGLNPSAAPTDVVLDVLRWYPLRPLVVHSTSWRHVDDRVILTYAAAVEPLAELPAESLTALPVGRADLARGGAMTAPKAIGLEAVLEHALRHLSWLVRDDPAVARALESWGNALADFVPEPFRPLE